MHKKQCISQCPKTRSSNIQKKFLHCCEPVLLCAFDAQNRVQYAWAKLVFGSYRWTNNVWRRLFPVPESVEHQNLANIQYLSIEENKLLFFNLPMALLPCIKQFVHMLHHGMRVEEFPFASAGRSCTDEDVVGIGSDMGLESPCAPAHKALGCSWSDLHTHL